MTCDRRSDAEFSTHGTILTLKNFRLWSTFGFWIFRLGMFYLYPISNFIADTVTITEMSLVSKHMPSAKLLFDTQ
jgi:hypothetical protein